MQIETISPRRAVDNAFLQEIITEATFETFRQRLLKLLNQADDAVQEGESEEHLKGLIKPFLNNTNFQGSLHDQTVFIAKPMQKPAFDFIPEYVVGLIASKIFMFYFQYTLSEFDDLFPKVKIGEFRIFPIRQASKNKQKEIATKANKVFDIKKNDPESDTSELEAKIDQLVYELYGLSEEEIGIVEESVE